MLVCTRRPHHTRDNSEMVAIEIGWEVFFVRPYEIRLYTYMVDIIVGYRYPGYLVYLPGLTGKSATVYPLAFMK